MATTLVGDIIGFDLGTVRTGVARINTIAKIAEPLKSIQMSDDFDSDVKKLIAQYTPSAIVVGMPRGLDAQTTEQTVWAQEIFEKLRHSLAVPLFAIDEAGTTKQAQLRVKEGQSIDSVAAGIILEDFITEASRGRVDDVRI